MWTDRAEDLVSMPGTFTVGGNGGNGGGNDGGGDVADATARRDREDKRRSRYGIDDGSPRHPVAADRGIRGGGGGVTYVEYDGFATNGSIPPAAVRRVAAKEEKQEEGRRRLESMAEEIRQVRDQLNGIASAGVFPRNRDVPENMGDAGRTATGGKKKKNARVDLENGGAGNNNNNSSNKEDTPRFSKRKKIYIGLIVVLLVIVAAVLAATSGGGGGGENSSVEGDGVSDGGGTGTDPAVALGISCPPTRIIPNDPGAPYATVYLEASGTAMDSDGAARNVTAARVVGDDPGETDDDRFPIGTTTVTFRAVDEATGNAAYCSVDVTVVDAEPPTVSCPPDGGVSNDPGEPHGTYVLRDAAATDNSGHDVAVTSDFAAPDDRFPIGITLVTFRAADASGNVGSCTATVTVTDNEPPTISCPPDREVVSDPRFDYATVALEVTAADNSERDPAIVSDVDSDRFPAGVTTLATFRATDGAGNSASCSVNVTVLDANCPWEWETSARNVTYDDKIILQNDAFDNRWLAGGRGGGYREVRTRDYYMDAGGGGGPLLASHYHFIVRSEIVDGSRSYVDPRSGQCAAYGDDIILQSDAVDSRWVTGGRREGNFGVRTDNYLDGGYEQRDPTARVYRWIARTTPGNGTRGDVDDPREGRCLEYGDRIYLQSNAMDDRWLTGSRGSSNDEVYVRDLLDEGYMASTYLFVVRGENKPGTGSRCGDTTRI